MKKLRRNSIVLLCLATSAYAWMNYSYALPQTTAQKLVIKSPKMEVGDGLNSLVSVHPHAVVIEQDDPDRYKRLLAEYNTIRRSKTESSLINQLRTLREDKSLRDWEQSNKVSRIYRPYQPIEVDVLDGEHDPLGIAYVKYLLKGVVSKRTIFDPPDKPGKFINESEEVYWYWDVPLSLRNDLARDAVNGGIGKTREVMAVWFCPEKWSLQSRVNPTVCYFAEKGLVWRKQIPLKETVATLPVPEAFDYKVHPMAETVLVSNSGKYVWVIATTTGYDQANKRSARDTFIFIYNDRGELTKTLQIPDYLRGDTEDVAVMDGEAFALTLGRSGRGKAEYQNVIFRADGTPVCRLVNQNGEGVVDLHISHDGQRAVSYQTDEKDGKRYACFYKLDNLVKPDAK